MNQIHIDLLRENINALNLSLNRLMYSFEKCGKIGIKDIHSMEEKI